MKTLQKFASVHANVHNHFNSERHLVDRQTYKQRRSAALAEWQQLMSLSGALLMAKLRQPETSCRPTDEVDGPCVWRR